MKMNLVQLRIFSKGKIGISRSTLSLALILLAAALCTALHDICEPFWSDEIITIAVCRLPNATEIWRALEHAVDTNPPLFYLAARLTRHLLPSDYLGYRLPSLIGLLGTILCIYMTLSKRMSRLSALAGAAFVLCTPLAQFACEARPRALMIGCVSCAVLAWQRIEDSRLYAVLVTLSLGAALSLHYYAFLVFPVFLAAEASLWISQRRFRVSAWASIAAGALPLLFFSKLVLAVRAYYGQHFWAQPSVTQMVLAHDYLFKLSGNWGLPVAFVITLAILYFSISNTAAPGHPLRLRAAVDAVKVEEKVLILMFLWLPEIATVLAKADHLGMTAPYMLPGIIGCAMAIGFLINRAPRAAGGLVLALFLMTYALSSSVVVRRALNGSLLEKRLAVSNEVQALEAETGQTGLPIVISDGIQYLQMAFYASGDSARQIYSVSDSAAAVVYSQSKTDSVDIALIILRRYFPLQVDNFDEFVSRHHEFLLVGSGGGMEWLPTRLAHDGDDVRLLSMAGGNAVYRVTMKP